MIGNRNRMVSARVRMNDLGDMLVLRRTLRPRVATTDRRLRTCSPSARVSSTWPSTRNPFEGAGPAAIN